MVEMGNKPAAARAVAWQAPYTVAVLGVTMLAALVWTLIGDEWGDDVAVGVAVSWPAAAAGVALLALAAVHFLSAGIAL